MTNHLLIFTNHAEQYANLIRKAALPNLVITTATNSAEAQPHLPISNIILGSPQHISQVINQARQIAWAQSTWAGVEPLLDSTKTRQDYLLTRLGGVFGQQMSEYVFGHLIMQTRQDWHRYNLQQKRKWHDHFPGTLHGRTIGILGVGSIGQHLAQTAKHFNMTVWGYTRKSEACTAVDRYFHEGDLLNLVAGADFIVNTLPHTAANTYLINQTALQTMKQHAILVNVGRGSAIDEIALVQALSKGEIAGAILDVFEQEPLPVDHPLWQTANTIITSHTAAVSYPHDVAAVFAENYHRWLENRPLQHLVDFSRGY